MLQITKFSIITLGKIEEMLTHFKEKSVKYKNLVEVNFGIGETLVSAHFLNNADFYFHVAKPVEESASVTKSLQVSYRPQNIGTIAGAKSQIEYKDIPTLFENWVNVLKAYDKIDLNKFLGDFSKVFEEEVYADFEILDEDASYKPFDKARIEFWYKYLSYVELVVKQHPEQDSPEIQELLNDVVDLKDNLDNKTKAEVVSKFAKLTAKAKKIGTKLGLAFWDEAKKEAIKYILKTGYDQLPNIANAITEFVKTLPPIHLIP